MGVRDFVEVTDDVIHVDEAGIGSGIGRDEAPDSAWNVIDLLGIDGDVPDGDIAEGHVVGEGGDEVIVLVGI